jgi:hypothetical protein
MVGLTADRADQIMSDNCCDDLDLPEGALDTWSELRLRRWCEAGGAEECDQELLEWLSKGGMVDAADDLRNHGIDTLSDAMDLVDTAEQLAHTVSVEVLTGHGVRTLWKGPVAVINEQRGASRSSRFYLFRLPDQRGQWILKPHNLQCARSFGDERFMIPSFYILDAALRLRASAGHTPAFWVESKRNASTPRSVLPVPLEFAPPPLKGGGKRLGWFWMPQDRCPAQTPCATSLMDLLNRPDARALIRRITLASVQRAIIFTTMCCCMAAINLDDLLIRSATDWPFAVEADCEAGAAADGASTAAGASSVDARASSADAGAPEASDASDTPLELFMGDAKKAWHPGQGSGPRGWKEWWDGPSHEPGWGPMMAQVDELMTMAHARGRSDSEGDACQGADDEVGSDDLAAMGGSEATGAEGGPGGEWIPWADRPLEPSVCELILSWDVASVMRLPPLPRRDEEPARDDERNPLQAMLGQSTGFANSLQHVVRRQRDTEGRFAGKPMTARRLGECWPR